MKALVVEDDFTSRKVLQEFMAHFGECDIAVNGHEAIEAFKAAHKAGSPYDLICLDLMMPIMDGHKAFAAIRDEEENMVIHGLDGVKVLITTCMKDCKNVFKAYKNQCEDYLLKPINLRMLHATLMQLGLVTTMENAP
jgi:two-component system chemotaxis response regulator CheY